MFISLGSIIGSGWLLGALGAAQAAGPASLISWVLAAILLMVLALIHAELGAAYPVAGGTARFPYFAFGTLAGFTAGWAAYLQAVTIAPIEVEAAISYLTSTRLGQDAPGHAAHATAPCTGIGLIATAAMLLFTIINLMGAKLLSDSNTVMVIWKTAVPLLAIVVIMTLSFHASNFTAGGGFMPYGAHGVFAALPLGVVFALQGFEQAIQMGGEARNPQQGHLARHHLRDVHRRGRLHPARGRVHRRPVTRPTWRTAGRTRSAKGDFGPYYTLALAAGAGWLATILLVDAVISPGGHRPDLRGHVGAAVLRAGRGRGACPTSSPRPTSRGVPMYSILLAFVIGEITFLPFPSWQSLVGLVTGATAIMYAFAPVSLAALQLRDPDRPRPYRLPFPKVLTPVGFIAANLIIYWGGFEAMWKLLAAHLHRPACSSSSRCAAPRTSAEPTSTGGPRRGSGRGSSASRSSACSAATATAPTRSARTGSTCSPWSPSAWSSSTTPSAWPWSRRRCAAVEDEERAHEEDADKLDLPG